MAPLVVDPQALFAAGSAVVAAGDGLAANLTLLTAGFAAHTGLDAAGMVFGLAYQDAAEKLLTAAAAAVNACLHSGAVIQQGAANYSKAEAASTLGGGVDVLQAPPEPAKITAPGPPGTWGKGEPPPVLWALVQSFLDDVWPDGDVAGLRAAAGRWRNFGAALGGMQGTLNASKSLLDGQHIPEGGKIDEALSQIGDCTAKVGDQCGKLAGSLDNFANEVEQAQNHIRDLLNRLGSLADLGHDVMLIIEGDAIDEIKKIAEDIEAVLRNLGREARAMEQGIKLGMQVVDGLVVKLEKYVRGQLTEFLGDEVGNPVATVFDTWVNANEGVLKGGVNTALALNDLDPRWFAIDPKGAAATWEGMGKSMWKGSLINAFLNPQEAGEANLQTLKGLLHLDDWSTARPGLGAGENVFDVATLFIPGAGEAGAAADGAGAAARVAEAAADAERAAGKATGEVGEIASVRGALTHIAVQGSGLTKDLEGVTRNLPKIDAPVSGAPVVRPGLKTVESPVESVPRPPDAAPGTSSGPTVAPESTPAEPPGAASDRHKPAPAPAGGTHDPLSTPGAPAAPAPAGGARDPVSVPTATGERSGGWHGSGDRGPLGSRPHGMPPHYGAPHAPGHDGPPGGRPHEHSPHDGGPHGPGDIAASRDDPSSPPGHDGAPGAHSDQGPALEEPRFEDPGGAGEIRHTISGHGDYVPAHGHMDVPQGTTITIYAEHGSGISDALGNLIETGGDTSGVYSATFLPGEPIPDYTIHPPDGLNIIGTPQIVERPTRLSELINENMGPVDLAVCTYDAACPTGKVYHVDGIFDEWTGTFQSYER